ncbi:MAG: hypothetical protein E7169_01040 [Firmicutes bacterium]|nr:hypothetical protein [Bacillota bacterium]
MDLVILVVLIGIVVFIFKKFSSFIYFIAIVDILLRILTFIKTQISNYEIYSFLNKYVPTSIPGILNNYSSGILNTLLIWLYVIAMIIFEYYLIRTFIKKK